MAYLRDYSELCSFDKVRHTPAWYYKEFPRFYNVECYRILANWQEGVRAPIDDQYNLMDHADTQEQTKTYHLEQQTDGEWVSRREENKKRKMETESSDSEDTLLSEPEDVEHNGFYIYPP